MVKHESHLRQRSACSPARSVTSSTVVQKHVGQTIVQLLQVRQRVATSSQRGCSDPCVRQCWLRYPRPTVCHPCLLLCVEAHEGALSLAPCQLLPRSNRDPHPALQSVPGQNRRLPSALFASRCKSTCHRTAHPLC